MNGGGIKTSRGTDLVHVWLHQNLTDECLGVAGLVDGGVRPQAVADDVHVRRLQPLQQQALQRLLQRGRDARDPLQGDREVSKAPAGTSPGSSNTHVTSLFC